MSKKLIYIGGKVSGLEVSEYTELFNRAKNYVSHIRTNVPIENIITPVDICHPDWSWKTAMDVYLGKLKQCSEVFFLPNWECNSGT